MTTKTRRVEMRIDADTDQLITEAAAMLHVTKSAFVSEVARKEARRVIARGDVTLMAPEVFDAMMRSLEMPDAAPHLAEAARLPRLARG